MGKIKMIGTILIALAAALTLTLGVFCVARFVTDVKINDDIEAAAVAIREHPAVSIKGIEPIKQQVSCGYASIEMLSRWQGGEVTEQRLLEQNEGKVTTATGKGFLQESANQLGRTVTRHTELTNAQTLVAMYEALAWGKPVPIEFAALDTRGGGAQWTLHYGIVTGMDMHKDEIIVLNPYGYEETYTAQELLRAMRFDTYEDMPWQFRLGFAVGMFSKNTLYTFA